MRGRRAGEVAFRALLDRETGRETEGGLGGTESGKTAISRKGCIRAGARRGRRLRTYCSQARRSVSIHESFEDWRVRTIDLGPGQVAFDRELSATILALGIAATHSQSGRRFRVSTDSLAAIQRIQNGHRGSRQRAALGAIRLAAKSNSGYIC